MGVELPLRVVVTILECCVTFSGVKLSIRSFVLFMQALSFVLFSVLKKRQRTTGRVKINTTARNQSIENSYWFSRVRTMIAHSGR